LDRFVIVFLFEMNKQFEGVTKVISTKYSDDYTTAVGIKEHLEPILLDIKSIDSLFRSSNVNKDNKEKTVDSIEKYINLLRDDNPSHSEQLDKASRFIKSESKSDNLKWTTVLTALRPIVRDLLEVKLKDYAPGASLEDDDFFKKERKQKELDKKSIIIKKTLRGKTS
jgi:hypothetical protein